MCLSGTVEAVRARVEEEAGPPRISRRAVLGAGAGTLVGATLGGRAGAQDRDEGRRHLQDLTHLFRAGFPMYTGDPPRKRTLVTIPENGFYAQRWTFGEHSGTHVDAPGHFVVGGRLAPELTPEELLVPAAVIDISRRAARDPDASVEVRDLVRFEERYGRIPRKAAVFMYSGWEKRVDDPAAYKNAGPDGTYHFPGFGIDALEWLLERRDISAIGVDTLSLDVGRSTTFDVHITLLGADKYGLENVANLGLIPGRGAKVFVGLIPWEEGSGGPCRVIARY
jgi:kynurenine formamidase